MIAVGSVIHDELHGDVTVLGVTDSPIRWPGFKPRQSGHHRGLMPVFFDGLVRAVVEEEGGVAHYWGVTFPTVKFWRGAIAGFKDCNEVFAALAVKRADPAFRKKYGYPD